MSGWTDDRVSRLKTLWADGLCARQIAADLGGTTRNAILGKVHRLGLPARTTPSGGLAEKPRKVAAARLKPKAATPLAAEHPAAEAVYACERITIMDLRDHHCRWPLTSPRWAGYRFCGATRRSPTSRIDVYCAEHAELAFRPAPEKRAMAA